jgi:RNA polymerase sigma-70 factor (TIGR02943 family)
MSIAESLAEHRPYLMRFARLQLRNDAWAEDAVSETLLAALAKPQSFEQRAQLRTWLVGILKHKIIDAIRLRSREVALDSDEDGSASASDELDALMFKADGHFCTPPQDWSQPDQRMGSQQFFKILEACLDKLPPAMGRVFLMREWMELESDEICKELQISQTNLYVLLHRARLRLRECLQLNWFSQPKPTSHTP